MRSLSILVFCLLVVVLASAMAPVKASSTNDDVSFSSAEQEALYYQLINELRCPKCQNQTIADSDAPLAKDLRERTYEMVSAGQSEQQVIDYMVLRYGDFVHYQPRFTWATSILWWGPWVVIGVGLIAVFIKLRWQPKTEALSASEQQRLAELQQTSERGDQHDR